MNINAPSNSVAFDPFSEEGMASFFEYLATPRERYIDWVYNKHTGEKYSASEYNLYFRVQPYRRGEIPWSDFCLETLRPWLDARSEDWYYTDEHDGKYW